MCGFTNIQIETANKELNPTKTESIAAHVIILILMMSLQMTRKHVR
jgi:hypothetical protein